MLRLPVWIIALCISGCFSKSFDDDDDDDWGNGGWASDTGSHSHGHGSNGGGGSSPGDSACEVEGVALSNPTTDGGELYYRAHVEFVFDGIDEDARIAVSDGIGNAVSGTSSWTDNKLSFAPNAPLTPSTSYSATLTHCAGENTIGFRTTSIGAPLEAGVDLVGKTYVVNLDDARFVKPAGVGALLLGLLEQYLLLGVTAGSDSEIQILGASSKSKEDTDQNTCEPSIDFPTADFNEPFFSVGPERTSLSVGGMSVVISDLILSGDFASDGSYIGGAILAGLIDARDLAGVLVDNGLIEDEDPSAVCDLIATFGVLCEECGDGADYCLSIYVDQITAMEDSQTLLEVETCDVDTCEEGCD